MRSLRLIKPCSRARLMACSVAAGLAGMAALSATEGWAQEHQGRPLFPPECALRDTAAVTNIEVRGEAHDVASPLLSDAGLSMLRARAWCYAGRTSEALDVYDRIIALRPLAASPQ